MLQQARPATIIRTLLVAAAAGVASYLVGFVLTAFQNVAVIAIVIILAAYGYATWGSARARWMLPILVLAAGLVMFLASRPTYITS